MESTPISDRRVYAQDTQPQDTRDGVIWVDTSVSPRDTYVYSTDSESWESIKPAGTEASTVSIDAGSVDVTVPGDATASTTSVPSLQASKVEIRDNGPVYLESVTFQDGRTETITDTKLGTFPPGVITQVTNSNLFGSQQTATIHFSLDGGNHGHSI